MSDLSRSRLDESAVAHAASPGVSASFAEALVERPAVPAAELPEPRQQRGWLLAAAGMLVLGLLGIAYVGSVPSRNAEPAVQKAAAREPAGPLTAMDIRGGRFTTAGALMGGTGASLPPTRNLAQPAEPLPEVANVLSEEWSVAVRLRDDPGGPVLAAAPPAGNTAPRQPPVRNSEPASRASAAAALPPLASTPALPALRAAETAVREDGTVVISETLPSGISVTRYRAPRVPTIEEQLASCRGQGMIAGEACRARVCAGHWGLVQACTRPEQPILP